MSKVTSSSRFKRPLRQFGLKMSMKGVYVYVYVKYLQKAKTVIVVKLLIFAV